MLLLVFVDGVGLGSAGAHNPFTELGGPILGALGGRSPRLPPGISIGATDATLGVPGLPQSATGQTAIFTGVNASVLLGGHLWAFPNATLREVLADRSVLKVARASGKRVAFLNPFPPGWLATRDPRRVSCSTWAAVASGEPLRGPADLEEGRAVSFDLTGERLRARGWGSPRRTPREAGRTLVRAAREVDLALFEVWTTDRAGHSRDMTWARDEVLRLRGMLDGILEEIGPSERVCLTSDHGNLEDVSTRSHTANPVPALWIGPDAALLAERSKSLTDIAPAILDSI